MARGPSILRSAFAAPGDALTAPKHEFVRLSSVETQLGFPYEPRSVAPAVPRRSPDRRTARVVLEDILRDALTEAPCYVTFSGGRDSSALLAVAVQVARCHGLPLPVPVTAVHPDAPSSDESHWQQLVLNHLDIRDQLVVEVRGQQRLLSESARAALRNHGVLWPEATQLQGPLLSGLTAGAALVMGEGGDNAITGGRVAPLRMVLRTWPPRRSVVRGALRSMSDRQPPFLPSWYTAAAAELFLARVVPRREALRWDVATPTDSRSACGPGPVRQRSGIDRRLSTPSRPPLRRSTVPCGPVPRRRPARIRRPWPHLPAARWRPVTARGGVPILQGLLQRDTVG